MRAKISMMPVNMTGYPVVRKTAQHAPALAELEFAMHKYRLARIEPVRAGPAVWFRMTPGAITSAPPAFDVPGLAFLFESSEPDLAAQVKLELDRFEQIRFEIENRTAIHVSQLQPRIEALLGVAKAGEEALINAAGQRLYQTLYHQTNQIISEIDRRLCSRSRAGIARAAFTACLAATRSLFGRDP
jgi:hypothetical protein